MCLQVNTAAHRRYIARFVPAILLYVVCLSTALWIFPRYHPTGAIAWLLALLPALPILAILVIVGLYLQEETDEFQRHLLVQSMIWSIGATLAVTTVWGFLENFLEIQHLQPYLVFPLFWFFVGITSAALKLRYR